MQLNPVVPAPAWFCVRTHSKHEHLAAAWIRRRHEIEVYLPRVRFRRLQPRGPVWFEEALFPNYLFARFELARWVQPIHCTPGVHKVVHFGQHWPTIPEEVIAALRAAVGGDAPCVIDDTLQAGDKVRVAGGALHAMDAVVTRVMPSRQRVEVLLDFLGRQTKVQLEDTAVARIGYERRKVFG